MSARITSARARRPATTTGAGAGFRSRAWLVRHLQAALSTLGQLARSPLATLMSATVIGIALALPTALYLALENVQALSPGWEASARISVYVDPEAGDARALELGRELQARPELERVEVIGRAEALAEYRELSGFGEVLDAFGDQNPLPAVLVLHPAPGYDDPETVRGLAAELRGRSGVDTAQFDLQWLERLRAVVSLLERAVALLAGFLGLAVLLIVGNTIRLGIQNRRDEIEVAKLLGATDGFIRRPFLYSGVWYGLLGGLIAWAAVSAGAWLLREPIARLTALYESEFRFVPLEGTETAALLGAGVVLGLAGSWLAAGRHLSAIEPS